MTRDFTTLTGIAAGLPLANVDTDKILSGRFLKTITREGLGEKLFFSLRYDDAGHEKPDFVLNRKPWRHAGILIALDNFGCGSSREHAPWALADFGIRCVIAPSFADIFYNNCFKNGILPIVLDAAVVAELLDAAGDPSSARLRIDLPAQTITLADGRTIAFALVPERKQALLQGLDEVGASLLRERDIALWERQRVLVAPPIDLTGL